MRRSRVPIDAEKSETHHVECVCVTLRRAARAFSQFYDDALAPSGLKITQFSLLRAVARLQPVSISVLAEEQVLDRTTLARNLAPLERHGLVEQAAGLDKRVSEVRLTPAGQAAIAKALPLWRQTQRKIKQHFDEEALAQLRLINTKAGALLAK